MMACAETVSTHTRAPVLQGTRARTAIQVHTPLLLDISDTSKLILVVKLKHVSKQ